MVDIGLPELLLIKAVPSAESHVPTDTLKLEKASCLGLAMNRKNLPKWVAGPIVIFAWILFELSTNLFTAIIMKDWSAVLKWGFGWAGSQK